MSMSCLWTGVESSKVVCLLPSMLLTDAQMLTVPLKWSATSKGIMSLTHRLKFAEPSIWEERSGVEWKVILGLEVEWHSFYFAIAFLKRGANTQNQDICRPRSKSTDLHGFNHRMAHLMTVVAHSIHRHIHCQLPRHWLPKGVPVQHWHVRTLHLRGGQGQWIQEQSRNMMNVLKQSYKQRTFVPFCLIYSHLRDLLGPDRSLLARAQIANVARWINHQLKLGHH